MTNPGRYLDRTWQAHQQSVQAQASMAQQLCQALSKHGLCKQAEESYLAPSVCRQFRAQRGLWKHDAVFHEPTCKKGQGPDR
ncbi:hypothetical protein XfCFBP8078_06405 [Xylella fastidiosa subsp. multiplex]|nr:hypothetical protein XfCFBP8078_06405 [Xylella fastidiosa subsp. multiplex]